MEYHLRDVVRRTAIHPATPEPNPVSPSTLRECIALWPTAAVMLETDLAGSPVITASNPAFSDFVGAPLAPFPLREFPLAAYFPDRRTPFPACMLPGPRAIHRGEAVRDVEVHARRPGGDWRVALMSAAPVIRGDRVAGALVTLQDITALRDSDARRDQFLAMLGHELRNPLMPIISSLAILDRAPADSTPARRALEVIGRQVSQMHRVVDDLLDVVRIARGKVRLQRELIDLCAVIERAAEDHRDVYAAAGVFLHVHLPPTPLWVEADAARLMQIIGNLLQNAAKYSARGRRVWMDAAPREFEVCVTVRDEGIGIRSEALPHIFEPFVQADDSLARSLGGLGLGLPLVKALVEMHDGRVVARSDGPGSGTTIVVSLPSAPSGAPARLASAAPPG